MSSVALALNAQRQIVPVTEADRTKLLTALEPGELFVANLPHKPRNVRHHRFFMALCTQVAENHSGVSSLDDVLALLKVRTGLARVVFSDAGRVWYELGSISFDAMDEGEFRAWTDKAKAVIYRELFPMWTADDQERFEREAWIKAEI